MIVYLDSSVILRKIFNQPGAFAYWSEIQEAGTSELTLVECSRVIDRFRLTGNLNDQAIADAKKDFRQVIEGMFIFEIDGEIISGAAGSFPTVVGALDAIHLHTALLWKAKSGLDIQVATHDKQMETCAKALNLKLAIH